MSAVRQPGLRERADPGIKPKMNGAHLNGAHVDSLRKSADQVDGKPETSEGVRSKKSETSGGILQASKTEPQAAKPTMERQLRQAQDVLGDGRLLLLRVAEQLDQLSPELEATAAKITRFKESRDRLQKDLASTRAQAQEFRKQQARLQVELKDAKAEVERLAERSDVLQAELDGTKPELVKLRQQAAELEHALLEAHTEGALNEYRARHRKRERDHYRKAVRAVRYFLFKPRLLQQMKDDLEEKANLVERSNLFDLDWYVKQHRTGSSNPIHHYLWEGALEGFDPHPLFDTSWYLLTNQRARRSGENPLVHYLTHGWKKGYSPHRWFDVKWYLERYPEVLKAGREPLSHYLTEGCHRAYQPHPNFNPNWYAVTYLDHQRGSNKVNPLLHFVLYGMSLGNQPNPHFTASEPDISGLVLSSASRASKIAPPVSALSKAPFPRSSEPGDEVRQLQEKLLGYEVALETRAHEIAYLTQELFNAQTSPSTSACRRCQDG